MLQSAPPQQSLQRRGVPPGMHARLCANATTLRSVFSLYSFGDGRAMQVKTRAKALSKERERIKGRLAELEASMQ